MLITSFRISDPEILQLMALLPCTVHDLLEDSCFPFHFFPRIFMRNQLLPGSLTQTYFRPWRHSIDEDNGTSIINVDKTKFEIVLKMHHFQPNEITVKVIDNHIVIEGKHEEKEDEHGFVYRKFSRRYALPRDVSPEDMTSTFSSDCFLTVTAPRKGIADSKERTIEIERTGEPHQEKSDSLTSLKSFSNSQKSSETSITE